MIQKKMNPIRMKMDLFNPAIRVEIRPNLDQRCPEKNRMLSKNIQGRRRMGNNFACDERTRARGIFVLIPKALEIKLCLVSTI